MRHIVRCIETGELFPSLNGAARAKGVHPSNLAAYLKYKMSGTRGGYHWEVVDTIDDLKIRCVETGRVYDNQTEAARDIGCSRGLISYALDTQGPAKGYHFERVNEGQ